MTRALQKVFEQRQYPQIHTILLPTEAHPLLRACPNVVEVICNGGRDSFSVLLDAMTACPHIEVFEGYNFTICEWVGE